MIYLTDYLLIFYIWSIAAGSVYGIGLFVMGKAVEPKKLIILSVTAAAVAPLFFLAPLSHGTKLYLYLFFLTLFLYRTRKYSIFVCTGAVLAGTAVMTILEYAFAYFLFHMEFDPSWVFRALRASPGALTGALLAIVGHSWLQRKPPRERFEDFSAVTDKEQLRILKTVPLTQLYTAFLIIMAGHIIGAQMPILVRFLPLILVGSILLSYYLSRVYFAPRKAPVAPLDLVDFIVLAPVVCLIMYHTGGAASPWNVLFVPLVMVNALKGHPACGVISILAAAAALTCFGVLVHGNGVWQPHLDLLYVAVYVFIYWLVRRFIAAENTLSKEVEGARRHLLANISHDLRTPVTLMQGYTEALLDRMDKDPASASKYLRLILTRANGLKRLTTDLLELVKLETRQISLNMRRVSARELLDQVFQRYGQDAKNKGISLVVRSKTNPGGEVWLVADQDRLDRVFANLIFNALSYTPSGGAITVGAGVTPDGRQALFSVSDTGPGIDRNELPSVFQRFYKGAKARHARQGSGLGLAIAKEIVECHGGRIWVESEQGRGSTFHFTLPRRESPEQGRGQDSPGQTRVRTPVPLAQAFSVAIVVIALVATGIPLAPPDPAQVTPLLALGAAALAGFAVYRKAFPGQDGPASFGGLSDTIILVPLIHLVLLNTGCSLSLWKILFIPLIITNALKPDKVYGLFSLFMAAASLVLLGIIDLGSNVAWFREQDLAYMSLFAVVYWVVRYFMLVETSLNRELAESRRTLITCVTRDLQNPLASIIERIQALIDQGQAGRRGDLLFIHGQVMHLRGLIEDLFALVQLESRRVAPRLLPVTAEELVKRAVDRHRQGIKDKVLKVEPACPGGVSPAKAALRPRVQVDSKLLDKAFANLLTAAAAEPQGTVTISFVTEEQGQEVRFSIHIGDSTTAPIPGVSGELDSFASTQDAASRLGVLIAQQIIKIHGGHIWTETDAGRLNGFSFTLPLAS